MDVEIDSNDYGMEALLADTIGSVHNEGDEKGWLRCFTDSELYETS